MPCFSQQLAIPMPGKTKSGKTPYKFIGKANSWWVREHGAPTNALLLPCRSCIGCRLEKSRQWATRLLHETKFHEKACFLTLTYDDEHLPENRSLNPSDFTTFIKDLRARCSYYGKEKLKYFACGEYGCEDPSSCRNPRCSHEARPHYHAILFGPIGTHDHDPERTEEEPARSGDRQWSHAQLDAVWPHGRHRFSEVTFESAAYVARYVLKKVSGITAPAHYGARLPEFQRSSHRLGRGHLEEWANDVYPGDLIALPGRGTFMPPPYYDRILEKCDPDLFQKVKQARKDAHKKMTGSEWLEHVNRRNREGEVRTLVTKTTLIRGAQ